MHIKINQVISKILAIMLVLSIFSCLLFAYGCNKKQEIIILHAGGGYDNLTYLNAQETFTYYYNQGYRYFEYDLQLSTDGKLIGTHAWEHLETKYPSTILYEDFKNFKLQNGFTPVNEEWLMETIQNYPDIKIIVDAKADTIENDVLILQRIEQLETIYNYDLSSNIIPEIFSKEMWETAKQTTSFNQYLFSHYKIYYSVEQILEYFNDELIWGISLPNNCDSYFRSQLYRFKEANKKLFMFTPTTTDEVLDCFNLGADGVYIDNPAILP